MTETDLDLELVASLVEASAEMIQGMLGYPDKQKVLADLEPSYVTLPPEFLAAARAGYLYARRIGPDAGFSLSVPLIFPMVSSIRDDLPALWLKAVRDASKGDGSARKSAVALSDLIAAGVFRQIGINQGLAAA